MGEINSDDDESSDDTFDRVHNVTCGNMDGCSGMDEADDYDSEHQSTSDNADYKADDDSSGSNPSVDMECADFKSSTDVTDKRSEKDKKEISDIRT